MDFDGTLSTELAMLRKQKDEYNDVITTPPPLTNDGKQMASQFGVELHDDPEGRQERRGGEGLRQVPDPAGGQRQVPEGRPRPLAADLSRSWSRTTRGGPTRSGIRTGRPMSSKASAAPTMPFYYTYNPAWAQVRSEHPFNVAFHDIVAGGCHAAGGESTRRIKRCEEIFAKFEIKA